MNKLFLVKVILDNTESYVSVMSFSRREALVNSVNHVGGGIATIEAEKKPQVGQTFSPKLLKPKVVNIVERDSNKGQRRERVAKRLQQEEQARQARAQAHKDHIGPKGMGGQKNSQYTNPNSRKAKKAARLAANRKK